MPTSYNGQFKIMSRRLITCAGTANGHAHSDGHGHDEEAGLLPAHSHGSEGHNGHSHSHSGHDHSVHDHSGGGGGASENINLRGAVLHIIGDLVQSIGVAAAGALIWWKQVCFCSF